MRRRLFAGLATAALLGGGLLAVATPASAASQPIHWNFEDGTLQGWSVETGSDLGPPITGRDYFHNNPTIRWNKEGNYFLSTEEDPAGKFNDSYTGVLNSPQFTLTEPQVSMLVAGGKSDQTYIAACLPDASQPHGCQVLDKAAGADAEPFILRTMDLSDHIGEKVFLQIVDESTGGWGHLTVDDIHVNYPPTPQHIQVHRSKNTASLSWDQVGDATGYDVYRSAEQAAGYTRLNAGPVTAHTYQDRHATADSGYFYRVTALFSDGRESDASQTAAYARPYQDVLAQGSTVTYAGDKLSGIEFPVGPMGAGGILHFGDGTRNESWIFNHSDAFADRHAGSVPNSFFAVRAGSQVRALQTADQGPFTGMPKLTFQGEYPLAHYQFQDQSLPVQVSEDVSNPTIPGDLKDSAIPTALYTFTLKNSSSKTVPVSLLASQQNAVGFDGVGTIDGPNEDSFSGYGDNANTIDGPTLNMTGKAGSMALTMGGKPAGTASWSDPGALLNAFKTGKLTGPAQASSPSDGTTVDGALASSVTLRPGEQVRIPVRLSWNFPTNPARGFGGEGEQYSNWWSDAASVDSYVAANYQSLTDRTRQFHDTLYDSNLPHYVLDRLSSGISVLHTPSVFWAKNGFFGGWEGYGCCWGMPNHVWEYAQTASALWPQVGQMWVQQWLDAEQSDGLLPYRYNAPGQTYGLAFDGQAGVVLSAYRTYLQSKDTSWLQQYWPKIQGAMDYLIKNNDADRDGLLTGAQPTTLDSAETGTGSWLGSLYLAAVNATAHMAALVGDSSRTSYSSLYDTGRTNQENLLWNGSYYGEKSQNLPSTVSYGDGSAADMLLGQWWSTQLGLGDIYDTAHMTAATASLFTNNYRSNFFGFEYAGRVYAEPTDPGLLMITWPNGGKPSNPSPYYDETWTGTEYSAAAAMIQRGQVANGLTVVQAAADRNDGRLRTDLTQGSCGSGDGGGNPFGDVECGQWYSRSMSGWSVLTALQGSTYDGPTQSIAFDPKWQPSDHRSFFTAGTGYGTFSQQRHGKTQTDSVKVVSGSVTVRHLTFATARAGAVSVSVNARHIAAEFSVRKGTVTLSIPATTVGAGQTLTVGIR